MSHCRHQAMDPETREAFKRAMAELKGAPEEVRQTFLKRGAEIVWQEVGSAEPETPRYEPPPVQAAIKRLSGKKAGMSAWYPIQHHEKLPARKLRSIEKAVNRGKGREAIAATHKVPVKTVDRIQQAMKDEGK